MTRSTFFRTASCTAALLAGFGAAPTFAQDRDPDSESLFSDEIVVTARRSEESIQDVPISVSAFTGDALLEQNIDNISELSDFTAGFQQQQAFGRSQDRPVIRGTSNILTSEGKVGVFIDGIPFFGVSSTLDFSNLDRVEIIKGPQSAVFGRGTLSGAINYVTRRPGEEAVEGQIRAEVAEFGQRELSGYANFRVTDWLAFGVNGKVYEQDGAFTNELDGSDLGSQETDTYSAAVFLDPVPDLSVSARYIYNQDDDGFYAIGLLPASANNSFLDTRGYFTGVAPVPNEFRLNTDSVLAPGNFRESDRGLLDVTWDIMGSGTLLTYQMGVTDTFSRSGVDQTYDENQAFFFGPGCRFFITNCDGTTSAFNGTTASKRTSTTHEVRLSSDTLSDRVNWRLGAFFSDDKSRPLPEFLEVTEFGPDTLGDISEVENFALYGGLEIAVTERVNLGLEARYAEDDITSTSQAYLASDFFNGLSSPDQIVGSATEEVREASFDSFAPRITLDYTTNDGSLLYGQWAQGNSPGGFNPADAPDPTFEEEKLNSFEIGAKTSKWGFDKLNVSGFWNVFDNQVLTNTYTTATGGVDSFRANIGETRILGVEFDFARYLTDDWTVYGSYGFLDAEITEGVDRDQAILFGGPDSIVTGARGQTTSVCTDLSANIPGTQGAFRTCEEAGSLVGNSPPLVSKHQLALGTRYDIPAFEFADVHVGADLIYRSSFYAQVHNLIETGDSTLVNLRLGVDFDAFTLQFWGKNVFDEDSAAGILRYVDFNAPRAPADRPRGFGITPQNPQQFGVTALFNF
ncbi:MAG: TonB-dependent receptor [Litorimonas sp.]